MIKINLLREPSRKARGVPTGGSKVFFIFLAGLALIGFVMMSWYWSLSSELGDRQAEVRELQQESARLQSVRAQLVQFEQQKQQLDARLAVVQRLQNNRRGPVRLMNALIASVPEDPSLWLTNLTQRGTAVTIEGNAFSVPAIAQFITQLSRRRPFRNVELEYWEEDEASLKFKLSCVVEN